MVNWPWHTGTVLNTILSFYWEITIVLTIKIYSFNFMGKRKISKRFFNGFKLRIKVYWMKLQNRALWCHVLLIHLMLIKNFWNHLTVYVSLLIIIDRHSTGYWPRQLYDIVPNRVEWIQQAVSPIGWGCRIHWLYLCRGVKNPTQRISWILHWTIRWEPSNNSGALRNAGTPYCYRSQIHSKLEW